MTNLDKQINDRMQKIGSKRNWNNESQAEEVKKDDSIVSIYIKSDNGIKNIDLTLEPEKFDKLSSETRLSFDEYCQVINDLVDEEEKDWDDLRMKDQINLTRDAILRATMVKYAEEQQGIDAKECTGNDINYIKRYDIKGNYIGEAVVVTLTMIPMIGSISK